MSDKKPEIKFIALDLDGTLFKNNGEISPASIEAINYAISRGVHVVISTGRPFSGLPLDRIEDVDINYAITTNGAAVYRIHPKTCLFEDPLDDSTVLPILEWLDDKDVHIACFIRGEGISPGQCAGMVSDLVVPDSIKASYRTTRQHVPALINYIRENGYHVQKTTLNFKKDADGTLKNRDMIEKVLRGNPALEVVCGGYGNLEFTKKGVDKGRALLKLAELLGVRQEETMAVGDTENDLAILQAAGVGVAMGNATEPVKAAADWVTADNEHDGVAVAIRRYVP